MSLISRHDTDVDQLAAPALDGGVLVWPSAELILEWVEANRRLREHRTSALPGAEQVASGPLPIATGHQPEMMHPGVWIKLVAAARLARATKRRALFVCVDNDLTDGIPLARPVRVDSRWRSKVVALGVGASRTFEQEPPHGSAHWESLFGDGDLSRDGAALPVFRDGFLGDAAGQANDYISRWKRGIDAITLACGESPIDMVRVSETFLSNGATESDRSFPFVAHLLVHAVEFAASYNHALVEYRTQRGIRGEAHPIPNLAIDGDRVELPMWVSRADGPRMRLHVARQVGHVALFADSTVVCTLDSDRLLQNPLKELRAALGDRLIRPRALLLTMYLRLYVCDLFIHGIGGAKYDIITDSIIRDFFRVEPPAYACVSATARLGLNDAVSNGTVDGVSVARHRLRTARFNPQRLIPQADVVGEVATALAERDRAIGAARNLRDNARHDHAGRRVAFQRIRSANQNIAHLCPALAVDAERALTAALQAAEDRVVTHSREWFTGLYTLPQLRALCARLPWQDSH